MGLDLGKISTLCSVTCLGIPSMSEGFHAKMSQFQVGELVLLLVGKAATDPNGFVGVFGVDLYCLGVLDGLEGSHRLLPCAGLKCDFGHEAWMVHSSKA